MNEMMTMTLGLEARSELGKYWGEIPAYIMALDKGFKS